MSSETEGGRGTGVLRPPTLRAGGDRAATRLELFFDLAYVLAIGDIATGFLHDLSSAGLGVFAGLFAALWLSRVSFTLYSNRFDTDDIVFRIAKLAATIAIAGCAASAREPVTDAVPLAACFLGAHLMLLVLYARAWRHFHDARPTIRTYLATTALSCGLWAASLTADGPSRDLLWSAGALAEAAGALAEAAGPLIASLQRDTVPVHMEHLPE